jgi:hypothetical protein
VDDPLWKMRHALLGVGLAMLLSVPLSALAGRWLGDFIADSYPVRVAIYAGLLLYLLVGSGLLLARVARHETRVLTAGRLLLWLLSLWLWPVLLLRRRPASTRSGR